MDYCKGKVTKLLVDYFENDFRRISHALEVLKHAEITMEILRLVRSLDGRM